VVTAVIYAIEADILKVTRKEAARGDAACSPPLLWPQLDEMSWFLTWRLPFSYYPLDSSKIKVFLCGTLSQTLDLENSATTGRSCCQQNSSTVELVYHTSDGQRVEAAYYTSEML